MFKSIKYARNLVLATPVIILTLASYSAYADIYKWRDNHGVTQYSDRPPVSGLVKATRNEIVNALQKKELCAEPVAKTVVASTKNFSANFFGGISNSGFNIAAPNVGFGITTPGRSLSTVSVNNNKQVSTNSYAPLKPTSVINSGGKSVSVFGSPAKPVKNTPAAVAPKPTVVANAAPSPVTAPTAVAPAPTPAPTTQPVATTPVPASVPTQLATNTPVLPAGSSIVQKELMPAVNISKNMAPVVGWTDLRIRPNLDAFDEPPVGDGDGQFRIDCTVSHMSNDDPIVYPGQQGAAHHHTFFGNTSINFKSNLSTLPTTGNSTCRGGIANRSAYWVPSMIDTVSSTPIKPYSSLWYYKTGYAIPKEKITAPPTGLRIVTGNMKATSSLTSRNISFTCFKEGLPSAPATTYIPDCKQTWTIVTHVGFPQCWDGKNLDSPDHISHMANSVGSSCPVSHPIAIPHLGLNVKYLITDAEGTKNWRLSSDNYAKNGYNSGFSSHADWVNGWDEKVMAGIVKNCLNAGKDCGNHMLGDGTVLYAENISWH